MNFITVATVLCMCLSTSFAALTPIYRGDYKQNGGAAQEPPKLRADELKINLDSPKIILDRPRITVVRTGSQGARQTTHDNYKPVSYESDTPQYGTQQYGTQLYGSRPNYVISQPSVSTGPGPYIADVGHDFGRIPAPVPIPNRTPSAYNRHIFTGRPVLPREQTPTQDQHEIIHYSIPGLSQGFSVSEYGIPVPRGHNTNYDFWDDDSDNDYGGNRGPGYGYGPSNTPSFSGARYAYGPSNTPAYSGAGYGQGPSNTRAYSAPVIVGPPPRTYSGAGYGQGPSNTPAYSAPAIVGSPSRTYSGNAGIASGKFLVGEAVLHGHEETVLLGIGGAGLHGHGRPVQYGNGEYRNGAPLKKY